MKTITCLALREFTQFVEGFGMVVGAPESSLDEAKKPQVPEHVVGQFVEAGLVKAPKGWAKAAPADADDAGAAAAADDAPAADAPPA